MDCQIGGHKFQVRPLTRGEIKQFRKEGAPPEGLDKLGPGEAFDEALDKIFKAAITKGNPDDLTQGEALELWAEVMLVTYGGPELPKKSRSPQRSSSKAKARKSPAKSARK
jgi:hypothetical protein